MRYLIGLLLLFFVGCTTESPKQDVQRADTLPIAPEEPAEEKVLELPWTTEFDDQRQDLKLVRNPNVNLGNWNAEDILAAAKARHPQILLELERQSRDTVFVRIKDAAYLTQQSGTAGAEAYLSEVTFSFTELPGIKVVSINFPEGDHAVPGTYTRDSFRHLQ